MSRSSIQIHPRSCAGGRGRAVAVVAGEHAQAVRPAVDAERSTLNFPGDAGAGGRTRPSSPGPRSSPRGGPLHRRRQRDQLGPLPPTSCWSRRAATRPPPWRGRTACRRRRPAGRGADPGRRPTSCPTRRPSSTRCGARPPGAQAGYTMTLGIEPDRPPPITATSAGASRSPRRPARPGSPASSRSPTGRRRGAESRTAPCGTRATSCSARPDAGRAGGVRPRGAGGRARGAGGGGDRPRLRAPQCVRPSPRRPRSRSTTR